METLHNLFEEQVEKDNEQFGIESVYLPNPTYTSTPDFCFVAMEPSMARMNLQDFKLRREQGFLNFLFSEEDFILQYCAYRYLCDEAFSYMVTDISKGAMKVDLANAQRKARYKNWKPLLRKELEFFEQPRLIAIGGEVKRFLHSENFRCDFHVRHFSVLASRYHRKDFESSTEAEKYEIENVHKKIKKFAVELLNKVSYDSHLSDWILDKAFTKELLPWKKGLLLNYKTAFSWIRNS